MLTAWRLSTPTSMTTALKLARSLGTPRHDGPFRGTISETLLYRTLHNALRATGHTHVRNVSRTPLERMGMSSVGTWLIMVRLEESASETTVEVRVQNLSDLL